MLKLNNVHTYYGKSHILQGVTLDVPEGEVVALLGRNGVGKSTTMRTIMGLTPPVRGQVMFNGEDITGQAPYKIAHCGIAYVPENRQVFQGLSVLENLRIGLDLRPWSEEQKTQTIKLIYKSFPRLKERETQTGSTLSGGEQQMLAMARAVVTRPKFILLDEPTEGLMPAMVQEIENIIRWMADDLGITILLVEQNHKLSLRTSSHCYIMAKGRIIHSGPSREIADDNDTLRACLGVS